MKVTQPPIRFVGRRAGQELIAWLGGAAFIGSLLYFLYFFVVILGAETTDPAGPHASLVRAGTINLALFSLFALHHSVLARPAVKRRLTRWVPGHLERSLYVWIASIVFFAVCHWWQEMPGRLYTLTGWARAAGLGIEVAGLLLVGRASALLDPLELSGIRQVRARWSGADGGSTSSPLLPPPPLTAEGPYGLVRHPLYLGWTLLVWGVPTMTAGRLLFAAASTAYLVLAIPWEERALLQVYGNAYREYTRRVRWRIFPAVY